MYNCEWTYEILPTFSQYLISLELLLSLNLKRTVGQSKRRSFSTLTFIVKSVPKNC